MNDDGTAASDCVLHDWVYLSFGFEICAKCRKIRRVPKHRATGVEVGQPHPRRIIGPLMILARWRRGRAPR
jgi:hypothetical protein